MKLKNRKTGKIIEFFNNTGGIFPDSLAELCEEWADYEEPKDNGYWYIDDLGRIQFSSEVLDELEEHPNNWMIRKIYSNYFDTREEAEKAVEKLKAFKRLGDKGFKFCGEEVFSEGLLEIDGFLPALRGADTKERLKMLDDLNICFGGEE